MIEKFTDEQKARILDDIVQASTTPEHDNEEEIVGAMKMIVDGAIDVLENKRKLDKLEEILNFDVGWSSPKILIDTINRKVLNKTD